MSNLVKINNKDLQVKEFNGQRVITFKDIDMLHERPEGTAGRNFRENKEHFINTTDYYFIKPADIQTDEIRRSEINNAGTYLITESGYLMLVKSLQDNLAWMVQRELVNNYFREKKDPYQGLSKELKAVFILDKRTQEIEEKVQDLEANMPLFNIDCKELQSLVRRIGIKALGGYGTPAYKDNSLRGKVYSDIQHEIRREFGVNRYEAIKRNQYETAKGIIEGYKLPVVLIEQIKVLNNQMGLKKVI